MIIHTPSGHGLLTNLFDADGFEIGLVAEAEAFVAELVDGPYEGQFFAGPIEDLTEAVVH